MESNSRTENNTEQISNESNNQNSQHINNDLVQTILKEINTAQQTEEIKQLPINSQQQYIPLNVEQPPEIYKQQPIINVDPSQYHQQQHHQQHHHHNQLQQQYYQQYQQQPQIHQSVMDIINNDDNVYNRITRHLKDTIIIMLLFILFSCENTRSSCASSVPRLSNNDSLNIFGTIILSFILGIVYISIKQFI